ncbi:MAG: Na/Pi cotransporter family protein, partial [Ruminococcaceae bacterium]|nr:Na/Pi cotransporter family protein [Oscillospiraceae bacterium]
IILKLLKPSSFTPVLALIGTVLLMVAKSSKKKDVGTILLGFSTLMFGMDAMSSAVEVLTDVPEFQNLFLMFKNPILGVLVGTVLTAIIQSSSASVGILQALSVTGAVSYAAAVPIIMGQNIGTCVTAMLSSIGTNKNAKRVSVVHLAFNIIGTVLWLTVFSIVTAIFEPAILNESASYLGIAVVHTAFKVLNTLIFLPMPSLLEKIAYKIIPEGEETETCVELDDRLLATPTIALAESSKLTADMAHLAVEGFKLSLSSIENYSRETAEKIRKIEDDTDHYEDVIGTFLTKIASNKLGDRKGAEVSKLMKVIGDFERISDHSVDVLRSVEELREKNIMLSEGAKSELNTLCSALSEILDITLYSFENNDPDAATNVEPLEQVIDKLKAKLRDSHIVRLQNGDCTVEAGFIWADLLTSMERTSDHCSNVAACVIDSLERNLNIHESLREMKSGDAHFAEQYEAYVQKYLA